MTATLLRNYLIPLFLILFSVCAYSQYSIPGKPRGPNSICNISIGIGPNYGFTGFKAVVGYNNSGLIACAGGRNDQFTGGLGGQVSIGWHYTNIMYGNFGSYYNYSDSRIDMKRCITISSGGIVTIGPKKNAFIDLSLAYSNYSMNFGIFDKVSANIGLGIKIK